MEQPTGTSRGRRHSRSECTDEQGTSGVQSKRYDSQRREHSRQSAPNRNELQWVPKSTYNAYPQAYDANASTALNSPRPWPIFPIESGTYSTCFSTTISNFPFAQVATEWMFYWVLLGCAFIG